MFYHQYLSEYNGVVIDASLSANCQQALPFYTTSSNRTAHSAFSLSSTSRYKKSVVVGVERDYACSSPSVSSMSSLSSMSSVVSSSASLSGAVSDVGSTASAAPFYSTSAYVSPSACRASGDGVVAVGLVRQAGKSDAMNQVAAANYLPESSASTTIPMFQRDVVMADVINFYTLAEELFGEKIAWGDTQASGYRRPDNPIGELTPVGDAILPLMACVIVYAVYKILRKINLRKANNV